MEANPKNIKKPHDSVVDLYKLIGVERSAKPEEIQDAIHVLSAKLHFADIPQPEDLDHAKDILLKPSARQAYDEMLGASSSWSQKFSGNNLTQRIGRNFSSTCGKQIAFTQSLTFLGTFFVVDAAASLIAPKKQSIGEQKAEEVKNLSPPIKKNVAELLVGLGMIGTGALVSVTGKGNIR